MSSTKQTKVETLRKKYANANINLVDVMRLFDPTKNRLLTDMMTEELINKIRDVQRTYELSDRIIKRMHFDYGKDEFKEISHNYILCSVIEHAFDLFGDENTYFIHRFKKYWDENKIDHDIQKYKTLDDVKSAVHILDIKEYTKSDSIKVHKVYEDDEWLLVLPLSLRASQLYGAGTKWCTNNRERVYYYYEHTHNGLLVYIINKLNNRKYAYQKLASVPNVAGAKMSQFYTAADACIDSVDLEIPDNILAELKNFIKVTEYTRNSDHPLYLTKEYEEFQSEAENAELMAVEVAMPTPPDDPPIAPPVDEPVHGNLSEFEPMDDLPQTQQCANNSRIRFTYDRPQLARA
jgi:hypothetical protein